MSARFRAGLAAPALLLGCLHAVELAAQQGDGVAVAARDLPRGAVLAPGDVIAPAGAGEAAANPVGWVTRRMVSGGEPLRPPTIAPPNAVRAGDTVDLVWRAGSLEIRVAGRAMNSATAGGRVLVRVDGRRRFAGVAHPDGTVHLDSPEKGRER
jgi:flagellar basal body P-ring formation protein FlgA